MDKGQILMDYRLAKNHKRQLESFNAELDATVKKQTEMLNGGKLYGDYQEVCIKNSKLNATVDVLVEKISMLKAVGCHG